MTEVVAACIGAMATIGVWFLSARQLKKQERDAKRREIRLHYLVEAYRRIEGSSNRACSHDSQYARDLESAIADIQLFGGTNQIELAQGVARDFASKGIASCDALLEEIRKDLRCELDLEPAPQKRVVVPVERTSVNSG